MKLSTMQDWLAHIGSVHQQEIELGLERVRVVAERLQAMVTNAVVIVVGGTNGKGSTVAALSSVYQAAGYAVGAFCTPVLFKHNEEVSINGNFASDLDFCEAFAKIESAKGEITLTPFEYHTLAALLIFQNHPLDLIILEVGMGGRLDAVNIMDADVSVITSIDLDHTAWLGHTRAAILVEKAGIMRKNRPVVIAEPKPPANLEEIIKASGALAYQLGVDYFFEERETSWSFRLKTGEGINHFPLGQLYRGNLAAALMVVQCLQPRLPVNEAEIRSGINGAALPGRQQMIQGDVLQIFDVAHNPHAISLLAARLKAVSCTGKTIACFSMLSDKDIKESVQRIAKAVDHWVVAPVISPRAASEVELRQAFDQAKVSEVSFEQNTTLAYEAAKRMARAGDRIVVFGSFVIVAEIISLEPPPNFIWLLKNIRR